MGISLFDHNRKAYDAALSMLSDTGKAAIIHPTGTGKSFIGFQLCADHPDATVCWVSPSDYIFRTQLENWAKAGGQGLDNIFFLTYSRLMNMSETDIDRIRPRFLVLDEFHRAGAEEWSKGVRRLLDAYPDAPMLGLSATAIRYLDNRRDMADELFGGNVASEMTLGEAIVRGILSPPKYVLSVYSYQEEYERFCRRAETIKRPWAKDKAEHCLDALKRAIEKADGLDVIFDKHMTDRTGKYLVFCANFDHMTEMLRHVPQWFGRIDTQPHLYSVYSYDPAASRSFAEFKADRDDTHLRLLFCIDALNEGIHVDDISGVILLRRTVSPIIYKQQIGRAMTASGRQNAVIFDVVDNISGLSSIDSIQEEIGAAVEYYRYLGDDGLIVSDSFRIYDEVRDCRELFDQLENVMSVSWDEMYEKAKEYVCMNGDLLVPDAYRTDEGYHLGRWISTQRKNYNQKDPTLTPQRVALLEAIGMSWVTRTERLWNDTYRLAKQYYMRNQTLDGIASALPKVNTWLNSQRQKYRSDLLTGEQVGLLNAIGMVWEIEDGWQLKYEAAKEYYREHGDLDIPASYTTPSGLALGEWYHAVRRQYRDGQLPEERVRMLEAIGIDWTSVKQRNWMRYYNALKRYCAEHGDADVPADYVAADGLCLGTWVSGQRYAKKQRRLSDEQVQMLEETGFTWQRNDSRWDIGFSYAQKYSTMYGDLNVPLYYSTSDGFGLGSWISAQRTRYKQKKLSVDRIAKLDRLGMCWDCDEAAWRQGYDHLKRYALTHGNTKVPLSYIEPDGYRLGTWLGQKRVQYKKGNLSAEHIRALEELGVAWDALEERWQTGYEHAMWYARANGHLNVPKDYRTPDGYNLFNWLDAARRKMKTQKLDAQKVRMLTELERDAV